MRPPVRRFLARAQLNEHRYRVARASERVAIWLARCSNPYVAYSGGKDSACVLAIVREQRPSVPAVYLDGLCAFPEVDDLLDATPALLRYPTEEPFLETLKRIGLDAGAKLDRATMQSTVWGPVKRLIAELGYDGMAYGLRGAESSGRLRLGQSRGAIFKHRRDGVLACQPIWDWDYDDVWALIFSRDIPYCRAYDRMWDLPERAQRISYWAGETGRTCGRYVWLKRNYPELWNRLAKEIPMVRAYA